MASSDEEAPQGMYNLVYQKVRPFSLTLTLTLTDFDLCYELVMTNSDGLLLRFNALKWPGRFGTELMPADNSLQKCAIS